MTLRSFQNSTILEDLSWRCQKLADKPKPPAELSDEEIACVHDEINFSCKHYNFERAIIAAHIAKQLEQPKIPRELWAIDTGYELTAGFFTSKQQADEFVRKNQDCHVIHFVEVM